MSLIRLKQQVSSLLNNNQLNPARKLLYKIVKQDPQDIESLLNLGSVCGALNSYSEAEDSFRQALHINSNIPGAWLNLGYALSIQNRHTEAADCFRNAIRIKPDFVGAYHYLGNTLREIDRHEEAISIFRKALSIQPENGPVYYDLGNAYKARGEMDKARDCFRQSLHFRPDHHLSHANLIACMLYDGSVSSDALFREQLELGRKIESSMPAGTAFDTDRSRDRMIKVGYISPDFRKHSVSYFFEPIICHHDRREFHAVCYSNVQQPDSTTDRLRDLADDWRDISGMNDDEVYRLIRSDGIDILVDLAGLTHGNRLEVLARRAAPVQVTYLGYATTTGLSTIDYRITDNLCDPEGRADDYHSEKLHRLPHGFLCYRPLPDAPPVASLPAIDAGKITFGSFNNHAKITPEVVRVWSEVLKLVPGSCLLCKAQRFSDPSTCQRYERLFVEQGIPPQRLEFIGQVDSETEHLSMYGEVDIGLDAFPYNGTATTCEALWMGVPVITLAGDRHLSRVGLSILDQAGLRDLVAGTEEGYIRAAVSIAHDINRLGRLRGGLRSTMKVSSLCDGERFTADLESSYRYMWRQWLESSS